MPDISVRLPDGSHRELAAGATAADLAAAIGTRLASDAVTAIIDGAERDLATPLPDGADVEIITPTSPRGLRTIRHSTAHVLAQAVLDLYPDATYAIGPPIENGFYYDFELPDDTAFTDGDLNRISDRMHEIIAEDQPFVRVEIDAVKALDLFTDHPYKREIIETVAIRSANAGTTGGDISESDELASEAASGETVTYYRNGCGSIECDDTTGTDATSGGFIDLCMGPHVPSTGRLGYFALQRVSGAYWRGDERNPMLQRIYGTAWATRKDLAVHLHQLAEAKRRDHRRLAAELDLLSWPSELGPGLAVWHPKGALVRKLMEDYSRDRHDRAGYEFVFSPHIAKSVLWETSGHLDFFTDDMYPPIEMDGTSYYPKPMNCPFHVMVYRSRQRSYRELPLRLFELGAVYRNERSGVVHGLLRSRGFTVDDSHIFCARTDVAEELASLLPFVLSVLRAFGFHDFQAKLSTRPQNKSVGEDALWDSATVGLCSALEAAELDYTIDEGGGAFYGPKIDVDVRDAIGRSWQLSTIQLDFNLPERFGLEYTAADGSRQRPVMIHRALFGSVERFFGVMIEHYAGAFPTWLAPVQARVLPVAAAHADYASAVASELREAGLRVEVTAADEPLGRRVRAGKLAKIPYVLVVGDADVANNTVGVNTRGGHGVDRDVQVSEFSDRLKAEVEERA